ncbi:dodecin family protein [Deferrisoma camini]|uniref:dodecin family protein n=1 Tax=Deferrisoma camini TaxID=1035120 RepID=UPI00046D2702|nr:dodecin family protein [Deferrisoma camini]NOY45365.1 dodecin domain-containing protein [Deltaproteobacteria bacterium]
MAVARVTELVAASPVSFDDAIRKGFERAAKTLRNITGFHVTEWRASVKDEAIQEYRVTMRVTFLLEDTL